jgi:hypothetical protein
MSNRLIGIALAVLCIAVPTAPASADLVDPHEFTGSTSQDEDLGLDTTNRLVGNIEYSIFSRCSNGRKHGSWFLGDQPPYKVGRDRRFSGHWRQSDFTFDPFVRSADYAVRGKFVGNGTTVRGVLTAKVVGLNGTVCSSGRVTFNAYS